MANPKTAYHVLSFPMTYTKTRQTPAINNPIIWAKKTEFSSTIISDDFMILSIVTSYRRIKGAFLTFKMADKKNTRHTIPKIHPDRNIKDSHTITAILYLQKEKEAFDIETGL
jgi:hypothetical protein